MVAKGEPSLQKDPGSACCSIFLTEGSQYKGRSASAQGSARMPCSSSSMPPSTKLRCGASAAAPRYWLAACPSDAAV